MKTRPAATLKYDFRFPGARVSGPIRFAIGRGALGRILVGRSQRGICAILLGEDPQDLHDQLSEAFPGAELRNDQRALTPELKQVIAFIDENRTEEILNLDIGGSEFQQKVWHALSRIPAGMTRSYREVAQAVGKPTAVRAVARACAANVLAIAIPCHRVVRSDGSISGYRWGVDRKRALLAKERKNRSAGE